MKIIVTAKVKYVNITILNMSLCKHLAKYRLTDPLVWLALVLFPYTVKGKSLDEREIKTKQNFKNVHLEHK